MGQYTIVMGRSSNKFDVVMRNLTINKDDISIRHRMVLSPQVMYLNRFADLSPNDNNIVLRTDASINVSEQVFENFADDVIIDPNILALLTRDMIDGLSSGVILAPNAMTLTTDLINRATRDRMVLRPNKLNADVFTRFSSAYRVMLRPQNKLYLSSSKFISLADKWKLSLTLNINNALLTCFESPNAAKFVLKSTVNETMVRYRKLYDMDDIYLSNFNDLDMDRVDFIEV